MTRQIHATIAVAGDDAQLGAYRRRVNELLDADPEARYRELHTSGRLDYRIKGPGVPYPAFVSASVDFPSLAVDVRWENPAGGESGRATIQAGQLTHQSTDPTRGAAGSGRELRVDAGGALIFALAYRRRRAGEWIGYVLSATQHAFFRLQRRGDRTVLDASDGVEPEWAERWAIAADHAEYAALERRSPIEAPLLRELDRLANEFATEWIWFAESPPAETAIERQRYEAYGFKVNPANVRAEKLKTAMRETPGGGFTLEMVEPDGREVAAILARHWLQQLRH